MINGRAYNYLKPDRYKLDKKLIEIACEIEENYRGVFLAKPE